MKRIVSAILAMAIALSLPAYGASAADSSVRVTIPTFRVTVNGQAVDSTRLKYPLIVHGDVTYFPLTWNWCRRLGLVSGYTREDGLYIASYLPEERDAPDESGSQAAGAAFTASLPAYPVYINGRKIDNSAEEYPLLSFRDITYLPLTWRFVTDEFGWDGAWSGETGYTLCTWGGAEEPAPGAHYESVSFWTRESYRDYAVAEELREERAVGAEPDEYGSYPDSYVGRTQTCYKLDYAADTLTPTESGDTGDAPYRSGAAAEKDAGSLFGADGVTLLYEGGALLDLAEDAGAGNSIDGVYAKSHAVSGMTVYTLTVYFTQGDTSVPPPYTPCRYYAFTDKGEGALRRVESWPTDQAPSAVYPRGEDGFWLCSSSRSFGSARYSNARGWICAVGSDLSETTLNGRRADWNSLRAIGTDDAGSLYLLNTYFSDFGSLGAGYGAVSPVNDGYFRLDPDGKLTKLHPFVYADKAFVTPAGELYIDAGWLQEIWHLGTGARIKPE